MQISSSHQHTLSQPAIFAGVGLHTGRHVRVAIRPAPAGHGVVFLRLDVDGDNVVPSHGEAVVQTQLGTVLGNAAGVTVSTVEHLLAAMAALCIDNALVELDGPEVPIMDGSAEPFVALLDRAGRRRQEATREYIEVLKPIDVVEGDKRASLLPCDRFEVAFAIDFPTAAIGHQAVDLAVDEDSFREELADCRTFGFLHEVEALRRMGLARGGSLDNAVVIDGEIVLNPDGLRRPDEFVRHKALDLLGDLALLGMPVEGHLVVERGGHALHQRFVRALLEHPSHWTIETETRPSRRAGSVRGAALARASV